MTKTIMIAAAAIGLSLGWAMAPASAAPAAPVGVAGAHLEQVVPAQMRRRRAMRRRVMRRRSMRARRRDAINARDPSRPVRQQMQGTTSGGPRR